MRHEYRWEPDANEDHIAEHGVDWTEAEAVVDHPARGYPRRGRNGAYVAWGQTADGRYLQVAYIFDPPGVVYVIHARDLSDAEKQRLRRRRR